MRSDDSAAYAAAQANYQRYRQRVEPYGPTDTWFSFKILGVVLRLALWVFGIGAFIICVIVEKVLEAIWPDADPSTIGGVSIAIGVSVMAWYVVASIRKTQRLRRARFISAYTPTTMNEKFKAIGMRENPPEPWFAPDGSPLYVMTPSGWVLKADVETLRAAQAT